MKLNFRDLKQQKFTIEAEPSETIGEVKNKIAAEKGWEAASQKLIYSGKILADANTVESYKIEEKGFIVCMVSKPKAAPVPKTAAPPATPAQTASTPAQPPAPQQSTTTTTTNPPATPTPVQSTSTASGAPEGPGFGDPSAMLVGNRNESTVRQMEAMGFDRAEIDRALRAAFFNPDRAIEYLLSGIPAEVQAEQQTQQRPQQTPAAQQPTSPSPAIAQPTTTAQPTEGEESVNLFEAAAQAGTGRTAGTRTGGGAGTGTAAGTGAAAGLGAGAGQGQAGIDWLRSSPHFHQLRQIVQQQPTMLEPILQQVAENNPQLAQMIGQNQEQFLQLLSEDTEGGQPPLGTIQITAQEAEAIARLCDLGFSRDRVIQAYFACDKNENLAANFLFEQPDEEEDEAHQ